MSPPPASSTLRLGAEQALYLYALTPASDVAVTHVGMDDETPVQTVDVAGCTAVVDVVNRREWTGEDAEDRLQSLPWVAPRACRHEEVVEATLPTGPVYPARFGTLFSSVDELADRIHRHREALFGFFHTVSGAEEWSVKGRLDRDRLTAYLSDADASDARSAGSGAAYLQQRSREQDARAAAGPWLDDAADDWEAALAPLAREHAARSPRPQPDEDGEWVLHRAFLVPVDALDAFHEQVEALHDAYAGTGLVPVTSGPWPPYTFRPALSAGAASFDT